MDGVVKAAPKPVRLSANKQGRAAPRPYTPARGMHQKPQRSRALMRKVVSRPDPQTNSNNTSEPKARGSQINPARIFRAAQTTKSPKVDRYGSPAVSDPRPPVSKHPRAVRGVKLAAGGTAIMTRPVVDSRSLSHQQLERLLDHALTRADAHKKMLENERGLRRVLRRLPKRLGASAVLLVLLLLGGYFSVQKVPQVSMKVAAVRAHVSAALPAYTPSGYGFDGPINYSDGSVTIKYTAGNNDTQAYTITQKASNWSSESMAASVVPKNAQVQTSQVRGATVYIYGPDNNAAWVNNGILYKIKDNGSLNSEQILKIADSL